ncbi:MAG: SxtJ family membrane protein [Planctomycetaceae bacterium]
MIRLDREPTKTDLKLFGASLGVMLTLLGVVLRSKLDWSGAALVLWWLAAALVIVYYAFSAVQRPLYRGWLIAIFPVARVMSVLVLGVVYFGVLTPIGIISRRAGRDPLRLWSVADSGWIKRPETPVPKGRYFRQH